MAVTILIHSSKTMRSPAATGRCTQPQLLYKAEPLAAYLRSLSPGRLQKAMAISAPLAAKAHATLAVWNTLPTQQSLAIDSFVGDIYSGLQADSLSQAEREYAQRSMRILSGLYGVLRPYDGVRPYRLEMGYKLPKAQFNNLYDYWGRSIAETLPTDGLVINLSAAEYTKTVLSYIDTKRVVAPRFLTVNTKTGQPGQVIVHTKIARGAFARWLLQSRVNRAAELAGFRDLNYRYVAELSMPQQPTFVCEQFGGIGLSLRLR